LVACTKHGGINLFLLHKYLPTYVLSILNVSLSVKQFAVLFCLGEEAGKPSERMSGCMAFPERALCIHTVNLPQYRRQKVPEGGEDREQTSPLRTHDWPPASSGPSGHARTPSHLLGICKLKTPRNDDAAGGSVLSRDCPPRRGQGRFCTRGQLSLGVGSGKVPSHHTHHRRAHFTHFCACRSDRCRRFSQPLSWCDRGVFISGTPLCERHAL
jgi:hypothetical protein